MLGLGAAEEEPTRSVTLAPFGAAPAGSSALAHLRANRAWQLVATAARDKIQL